MFIIMTIKYTVYILTTTNIFLSPPPCVRPLLVEQMKKLQFILKPKFLLNLFCLLYYFFQYYIYIYMTYAHRFVPLIYIKQMFIHTKKITNI